MTATEGPAPHVLVVDDDVRIRTLLRRYLAQNGYLVTEAADAAQARRLLTGLAFDLLVLDVMMPGEDGMAFARAMRRDLGLATPVLMLTARSGTDDRIAGLESGVDDYLPKPFEPRELLLRAAAILRRAAAPAEAAAPEAPPQTLTLGEARYDVARGELWRGDEAVRLTASESALMRLLAAAPWTPVSRGDLVAELGGGDAQERAVDVQITRLRRKIEPDPREPRYLQTVRGEGYMLAPD